MPKIGSHGSNMPYIHCIYGSLVTNEVDDAPEFATFVTFRGFRLRKAAEGTPAPGRPKHYNVPKS